MRSSTHSATARFNRVHVNVVGLDVQRLKCTAKVSEGRGDAYASGSKRYHMQATQVDTHIPSTSSLGRYTPTSTSPGIFLYPASGLLLSGAAAVQNGRLAGSGGVGGAGCGADGHLMYAASTAVSMRGSVLQSRQHCVH